MATGLNQRFSSAAGVDRPLAGRTILIVGSFAESLINFRGPLIQALIGAGAQVHAAAPKADATTRVCLSELGVCYHELDLSRAGLNAISDLRYLLKLRRLIARLRPALVMAYTMKPVVYSGIACRSSGTVFVPLITGLGYTFLGSSRARAVLRAIVIRQLRLAFSAARFVMFQNPDDRALFADLGIVHERHVSIVIAGSGVDLSAFRPTTLPDTPVFLMIGRLLKDKGVREYAQAASIVRRSHPRAEFHLVGWIDENPAAIAQEELDTWIREGSIRFLGRLADVRPAITACRIYVLPSYREGLPRTIVEAMAMGRPIVTTDAPGCRETVIPGVNGLLVPPRNAASLAKAMLRMLSGELDLDAMARASVQIAKEKFDAERVGASMVEVLSLAAQAGS